MNTKLFCTLFKKALLLLLSLCLLLSAAACGEVESEPEPTPEPTVEPTPEPTPCAHVYLEGECLKCRAPCPHEWENGVCRLCELVCEHHWDEEGVCTVCGLACAHEWDEGVCTICGYVCRHENHDRSSLICRDCGMETQHHYINCVCSCGAKPQYFMSMKKYPEEILSNKDKPGTLTSYLYDRRSYEVNPGSKRETKYDRGFVVYTPHNYDPAQRYNVVVLCPGVNQNCHTWLEKGIAFNATYHHLTGKALIDGMIAQGYCEPTIFVSAEYYQNGAASKIAAEFEQELREAILPSVVKNYSTYASLDESGHVIPAREHFAFAAVSFGSIMAWDLMTRCSDLFSYWGCYAGNFTDKENMAERLDATAAAGYPENFVYTGIGLLEEGWNTLEKYTDQLEAECDSLEYGKNIVFHEISYAIHWYSCWFIHLHNSMQVFFYNTYKP